MSVSIKPLEDRIVVQTLEAEQTTASGLVIPDTAKEKPQEGTVIATGPGRFDEDGDKRIPLDVKVGDVVILMHNKVEDQSAKGRMDQWLKDGQMIVGEHQIQAVIS